MEEIEYEEFLRLENGKIVKYGEKTDTRVENDRYIDYSGEYEWETRIVKHSKNIIDLIKAGDYVNGEKVTNIDKYTNIYTIEWEYGNVYTTEIINDKFIKSIITKEQFAAVEYKLDN